MEFKELIKDESEKIEFLSPLEWEKVGQVYCYLSSGPIPLIKIGKGKNGRQRISNWLKDYPPEWQRSKKPLFVVDKINQSKAETDLHHFFHKERVSADQMREYLGLQKWQSLPDGASEWFHVSENVKKHFMSCGFDLDIDNNYDYNIPEIEQYSDEDVYKILDNMKPAMRWNEGSDCRELFPYVNALLREDIISHKKGEFNLYGTVMGNTLIIRESNNDNIVTVINSYSFIDGGYHLSTKDAYTHHPLEYNRTKNYDEKKNSLSIKTDFIKVFIVTIVQSINSYYNPPSNIYDTPQLCCVTYPNGSLWTNSYVQYNVPENYKNPIKTFLDNLKSKLAYGGVYGKLTADLPLGDLKVGLVSSDIAGCIAVLIELGSAKKIRFHVPAYNLEPDDAVKTICNNSQLQYDKLYSELSSNYSEEQKQQARTTRGFSIFFTLLLSAALIGGPVWVGIKAWNATSNWIENIQK